MTFHILTKRYTAPINQGTHDKLHQILKFLSPEIFNRIQTYTSIKLTQKANAMPVHEANMDGDEEPANMEHDIGHQHFFSVSFMGGDGGRDKVLLWMDYSLR